jgi:hypothetical protein
MTGTFGPITGGLATTVGTRVGLATTVGIFAGGVALAPRFCAPLIDR